VSNTIATAKSGCTFTRKEILITQTGNFLVKDRKYSCPIVFRIIASVLTLWLRCFQRLLRRTLMPSKVGQLVITKRRTPMSSSNSLLNKQLKKLSLSRTRPKGQNVSNNLQSSSKLNRITSWQKLWKLQIKPQLKRQQNKHTENKKSSKNERN